MSYQADELPSNTVYLLSIIYNCQKDTHELDQLSSNIPRKATENQFLGLSSQSSTPIQNKSLTSNENIISNRIENSQKVPNSDDISEWVLVDKTEAESRSHRSRHVKTNSFIEQRASIVFGEHLLIKSRLFGANSTSSENARNSVVYELFETEGKYLVGIEHVLRNALIPIQKKSGVDISETLLDVFKLRGETCDLSMVPELTPLDIYTIFSNIESIYITNTELLSQFKRAMSSWTQESTIGNVLADFSSLFKIYCIYIDNLSSSLSHIKWLRNSSIIFDQFAETFKKMPQSKQLGLEDYLTTPVQRISRYTILLESILKVTPEDHPDVPHLKRAIKEFIFVADYVNKSARNAEERAKVVAIQNRFLMRTVDIVAPARLLVKEGTLTKLSLTDQSLQQRQVFLFTDMFLTATPLGGGFLKVDKMEPLQNVVIMDREDNNGRFTFFVLSTTKTHILVCSTFAEKKEWMDIIGTTTASLISKAPWMEAQRNSLAIHVDKSDGTPYLIPVEALDNPNHRVFQGIQEKKNQSTMKNFWANTYQSIRSWFG